jgi:tetratricopeptide (TPR) repeat protein
MTPPAPPVSINPAIGADEASSARLREWEATRQRLQPQVESGTADAAACRDYGLVLFHLGRFVESLGSLQKAQLLAPRLPGVQRQLGDAYRALGHHAPAAACYQNAVLLQPADLDARCGLGLSLIAREDFSAAAQVFRQILATHPDHADAMDHLACALASLGQFDEAMAFGQRSLALSPHRATVHLTLGAINHARGLFAEAEQHTRRALAYEPRNLAAGCNLGVTLAALERLDEAEAWFRELAAIYPESPDVAYTRSFVELAAGHFAAGWEHYEARWIKGCGPALQPISAPLWTGEAPLAGRSIFLHYEQGLGDTLQFVRYAPLATAAGARVILGVQPELKPLLSLLPRLQAVISPGDPSPVADYHCPLLSLPRAFATQLDRIPADVPYLSAPAAQIDSARAALGPGRKVGLVWAGNPNHKSDRFRSLALAQLAPLLEVPHVRFINLQKVPRAHDLATLSTSRLENFPEYFADFASLAALVVCLDVVITVDTSIAHLAGALGVPVWVLLPTPADWRWLTRRDDSPWYPTMRLFRQPRPGDWTSVIETVRGALASRAAASG